jgi:methanethiol S-methyltransferase
MKRLVAFAYGVVCYLAFLAAFAYAIGFLGNLVVPKTIDGPAEGSFLRALLIDLGVLSVFALQHSLMARPWFKKWWTRVVPEPVERSTYVLFSSLALLLLFWQWLPIGGVIWEFGWPMDVVVRYSFGAGWVIVLVSTLLINHADLFGLRQVWLYFRKRSYTPLEFRAPLFYSYVRHPLYLGWLMVFWSAPTMTVAHLVFALATTVYIFTAIRWEENDLISIHGFQYEMYRDLVPMILPTKRPSRSAAGAKAAVILGSPEKAREASAD